MGNVGEKLGRMDFRTRPKSGYQTAAEGKRFQWRRNLGMIAMDLKVIWECQSQEQG